MDYDIKTERRKKKDKAREKDPYSSKHVRRMEEIRAKNPQTGVHVTQTQTQTQTQEKKGKK